MILISLVLLMSSALFGNVSAAPPELKAKYSANSPTIDGFLGSAEWNDTIKYVVNMASTNASIETWLYIKHNGTHINLGILLWSYAVHSDDQFMLTFDEGDDGSHGSGTRDYVLTSLQEDIKAWDSDQTLWDGFYSGGVFHMYSTEIDFFADATHETDHSTLPTEIEYWEGIGWVDDHWECEFSIPFEGNEGMVDVSDLSCTALDTVGIKIAYGFTGTAFYYPAGNIYQVNTYANLSFPPPVIESCNAVGEKKDNFNQYEDVYVNGSGFLRSTTYDFYIVSDVATWTDGKSLPTRVADTATTIVSDSDGEISPVLVWTSSTVGKYDMVVDVNSNGLYDEGIDALDNNDVDVTAGFMIPEFTSICALLLFQTATLLSIVAYKRKHPT